MRRLFFAGLLLLSGCHHAQGFSLSQIDQDNMLYTVAVVDPARDQLGLYWRNPETGQPFGRFYELQQYLSAQGRSVLFATNSGMYAEGSTATGVYPVGLHIEQGKTLKRINNAQSGGNFAMLPNGVFWTQGSRAGVTETNAFKKLNVRPTFATQSGPLLVQGGVIHPMFNREGTSYKTRSGVGVCKDGLIRFVVSAGPINFYTFALFFRDTLKCPDALFLDGSISAYATHNEDTQLVDFAGMWVVTAKR